MWRVWWIALLTMSVAAEEAPGPDGPVVPPDGATPTVDPSAAPNEQSGDLNSYQNNSGNNNTTSTTNASRTYNGAGSSGMPASTAMGVGGMLSTGQDSCLMSSTMGIQTQALGFARGKYHLDPECERRKNAKLLNDLGLKIAGIAMLCTDKIIYRSLLLSGTPCPIIRPNGALIVGRRAFLEIKRRPELWIPDYSTDQEYYDSVLGINGDNENEIEEVINGGSSLSERYRSSIRSSTR